MALNAPSGSELLDALREFLDKTVAPQVDATTQFNLRIAGNVIGIVQRELEQKGPADAAERAGLLALMLDAQPTSDLAALNRRLVAEIRAGAFDQAERFKALLAHLQATTATKLAIDNPRYR